MLGIITLPCIHRVSIPTPRRSNSRLSATIAAIVAIGLPLVLSASSAHGAIVVINNGLAPPNPANVIDAAIS